ncbi:MAG: His-Xaa-Ser system radical SAM maturase HxsC [Chthoniobacterales bacterium]
MLKLSSTCLTSIGAVRESGTILRRISENRNYPEVCRKREYFLVRQQLDDVPLGFAGYLFFEKPTADVPPVSYLLEPSLSYLQNEDIVKINPERRTLRTVYRRNARHNSVLVTERCNNYCLMCSQPPRDIDDAYLVDEIIQAIPLMSRDTRSIGITGGEPTLLGNRLADLLRALGSYLPATSINVLSNGRRFKDFEYAKTIADARHPDLMVCIPVYSHISSRHDYVVQADGAFDDTIRGIINLKAAGLKVEIRVVLHKLTYEHLPQLARFIRRNLTFCDHVALMGLEMTGFTRGNLEKLWIDPKDYQPQLKEAVTILDLARIRVSIYNHQLCILDESLHRFSRKSISDWKNEFMPECDGCMRKRECGGFFSSAKLRYSSHIVPFRD